MPIFSLRAELHLLNLLRNGVYISEHNNNLSEILLNQWWMFWGIIAVLTLTVNDECNMCLKECRRMWLPCYHTIEWSNFFDLTNTTSVHLLSLVILVNTISNKYYISTSLSLVILVNTISDIKLTYQWHNTIIYFIWVVTYSAAS